MVDLILAVDDAAAWHRANLQQHASHYSALRWLGPRALASVQAVGAGVYYNTDVVLMGRRTKYGVVTVDRLEHDLRTWQTLYLAGRLHKPVAVLRDLPRLRRAVDANRDAAAHVALLLQPARFTTAAWLHTIAGLSYTGTHLGACLPRPLHAEQRAVGGWARAWVRGWGWGCKAMCGWA
jgi:mitochondrial translocator assembly and maintenance protein 41